MDFKKIFHDFTNLKVAVIGDVMLDTYWLGKVERISPEAPVPVVSVNKKEQRIGGAGNVALNLSALGVTVSVVSVIGKDDEGQQLIDLLNSNKINTDYCIKSESRITTNKIRIISRNQHMMRLDAEQIDDLNSMDSTALLTAFERYVINEKPDVVILEDYNKGVLTHQIIEKIIAMYKILLQQ
jgi:D-glycero-beta-D-manno-heptose-7-phosphate kinase